MTALQNRAREGKNWDFFDSAPALCIVQNPCLADSYDTYALMKANRTDERRGWCCANDIRPGRESLYGWLFGAAGGLSSDKMCTFFLCGLQRSRDRHAGLVVEKVRCGLPGQFSEVLPSDLTKFLYFALTDSKSSKYIFVREQCSVELPFSENISVLVEYKWNAFLPSSYPIWCVASRTAESPLAFRFDFCIHLLKSFRTENFRRETARISLYTVFPFQFIAEIRFARSILVLASNATHYLHRFSPGCLQKYDPFYRSSRETCNLFKQKGYCIISRCDFFFQSQLRGIGTLYTALLILI